MQKLNLPIYSIKLKKEENKTLVFDPIRKKHIVLTPEEWVRQNFIQFLIEEKNYPASLMAVEMGIDLLNTKKRCDIVLYNTKGLPHMIVECKAPSIKISQDTFDQIARYNMTLKTELIVVTNGLKHENEYSETDGVRGMRPNFKEDTNKGKAISGRIGYQPNINTIIGFSGYRGNSKQEINAIDGRYAIGQFGVKENMQPIKMFLTMKPRGILYKESTMLHPI